MEKSLKKIINGYMAFRNKYAIGDHSVMHSLSRAGQQPEIMVVACCDSRVDPALILQCDPGDLFVVRNVANIVPPYSKDQGYHDTNAALEFGIRHLKVKHLIILGHSQCGGINALIHQQALGDNDFIARWGSLVERKDAHFKEPDYYAKLALTHSYQNCLTFPWIKSAIENKLLSVHLWFFNINEGEILTYSHAQGKYQKLGSDTTDYE
uniref:Carbonic anhydrase 1 n=1 Tax=Candidatus Berkiella aquae TaxID=295108 RepID=A0A0Q9YRM8_9GAMM